MRTAVIYTSAVRVRCLCVSAMNYDGSFFTRCVCSHSVCGVCVCVCMSCQEGKWQTSNANDDSILPQVSSPDGSGRE